MTTPKLRIAMTLVRALGTLLVLICISSGVSRAQASPSPTPTPAPPTLRMSIVYPTNGVLYQNGPDTIQAAITLEPPPTVPVHKYKVVIAVTNATGQMTKDHSYRPNAIQSVANVKMKKVPAGEYFVAANVYDRKDTLVGTAGPFEVIKMDVESSPTPTSGPTTTATPVVTPTATATATRTVTATITSTPTIVPPTATPTAKPTAAIISPLSGSAVSGVVNVSVKPESGASSTDIYIDGEYWTQWSANPTPWNSTTVSNGPHTIGVHSVMSGTTTGVNSIGFTVDNSIEATATQTATISPTARATSTATLSATATTTTTVTPTSKATPTPTSTATHTAVATPTATNTKTATATQTKTATRTPTGTPTVDPTAIPTASPTATSKVTQTPTPAPTPTPVAGARWELTPTSTGFEWVAPNGTHICKMASISLVDTENLSSAVYSSKYGNNRTEWGNAQTARLESWGFNAVGMYSYAYQAGEATITNPVPYNMVVQLSDYSLRSGGVDKWNAKNLYSIPNTSGMVCGSSIYQGEQADAFDPQFVASITAMMANNSSLSGNVGSQLTPTLLQQAFMFTPEEADDLYGIDQVVHEHMGYVVLAQTPSVANNGSGFTYPNHTLFAKIALRDRLAYDYGCTNPVGDGVGTPIPGGDALYGSGGYCGSSAASSALSALNAAWHTEYTTWGTTDAQGEAGIASGSYASWGTGTGLLDENGAGVNANCALTYDTASPGFVKQARTRTDLDDFVAYFATVYAQEMRTAISQVTTPLVFAPVYNAPPFVYTAMAPYFDGFWVNPDDLSELQGIMNAAPGTPLILADYFSADLDSPFWAAGTNVYFNYPTFTTQPDRATGMSDRYSVGLHLTDPNGVHTIVGLEHWSYYDMGGADFGLISDNDNPYDGSASALAWSTSNTWHANQSYTASALIFDGSNYQALSNQATSCTSGSSTPAWAAQNGSTTTDGSCTWRNEGPYVGVPETSIPGSATYTNGYGDTISPLATLLNAGICD